MDVTIGQSEMGSGEAFEHEHGEGQGAGMLGSKASASIEALRERAQVVFHNARAWVIDNPFAALGVAVATGFLAGRMMRALVLRS